MRTRCQKGFTILELLTVLAVSSLMLVLLAVVFKTGLTTVAKSSGRIEVVRLARNAIDQTQRYLGSACRPGFRLDPSNNQAEAIFGPATFVDNLNGPATDHLRFWSAIDHLSNNPVPQTARQLQETPNYFAYDLTTIPGTNGRGQDLIIRQFHVPAEPTLPFALNTSRQPRVLGRALGIPVGATYADGFVVRYIRRGAVLLEVNVASEVISDDYANAQVRNAQKLRIKMRSIYQLPFYSVN